MNEQANTMAIQGLNERIEKLRTRIVSHDAKNENLEFRILKLISAAHIKEYTRTQNGKTITVHEHEDARNKWTGGAGGIHLKRTMRCGRSSEARMNWEG